MSFRIRTKEEALKEISNLVEVFENNLRSYKSNAYDEANTRADFIDKFFEALNWDVRNDNNKAERFRNVIREDKVEIQGSLKAPDYSFSIGGQKLFFVEAKKPSVDIEKDIDPAYQLRRYAYTAKLPISILTDFEELAIYDTRIKPKKNDKASTSRIEFIKYSDYVKKFDFIWETFEFNAVEQGKLDKYVGSDKKKGTATIDKDLLNTIENWRVNLASNIALRNIQLSIEDLNFAVQKIVDRIIFLRIVEEKGIEQAEHLLYISNTKKGVYKELVKYFDTANERYNAGLFQKYAWLNNIEVDDSILIEIIRSLYFPECPYAWDVLPIEILGNIYEKFLGSEITFKNVRDGKHTAKVEEKPEVRKAGGVYYTPQYIVDYIVNETLGKKLEKSNIDDASKITICDPACGSGSFLVGAYKYLLNWYLEKYTSNSSVIKDSLVKDVNGHAKIENIGDNKNKKYKLTIEEKKEILKNHIYGVDIDFKATEVAKLSLFLVLLDGEGKKSGWGEQSISQVLDYKLLPNMSNNIKCGNSLVETDFYTSNLVNSIDKDLQNKINAFDWEKEFEVIFKNGGFDIVIGNPPYGISIDKKMRDYITNRIGKVPDYEYYYCFMELSYLLLKQNGTVSFIVPNTWLFNTFAKEYRLHLLEKWEIREILDCTNLNIFEGANVKNSIFCFEKRKVKNEKIGYRFTKNVHTFEKLVNQHELYTTKSNLIQMIINWGLVFQLTQEKISILNKIQKCSKPLSNYFLDISQGLIAYDKYKGQSEKIISERAFHYDKYKKGLKKCLWGEDVKRYVVLWNGQEWIDYCDGIANPRKPKFFIGKRLLIREITNPSIFAAITNEELYNDPSAIIVLDNDMYPIEAVLCILNSKLATFYHFNHSPKATKGTFPKILVQDIKDFPLVKISNNDKSCIVELANKMISVANNLYNASNDKEKKIAKDIVDALDKEINNKVYELYGLTKEEIEEVEKQSI